MIYNDGRMYEGHFENDRKHGIGIEIVKSGGIYEG